MTRQAQAFVKFVKASRNDRDGFVTVNLADLTGFDIGADTADQGEMCLIQVAYGRSVYDVFFVVNRSCKTARTNNWPSAAVGEPSVGEPIFTNVKSVEWLCTD